MLPKTLVRIVLTCLLLQSACFLKSQNLNSCRSGSYYTYVYALSNAQVRQIYTARNSQKYLEDFLTQPVDSFCSDSGARPIATYKKAGYSHYALVKAHLNKVRYELSSDVSFGTYLYSDQKKLFLFVYDRISRQPLSNVVVELEGKKMPYDKTTQSYILPQVKNEKLVSIRLDKEEDFRILENRRYRAKPYYLRRAFARTERFIYKLQEGSSSYQGYIAFNKPKYLPHDTVKLKAFVVNKKGKPLREPLSLMFGHHYSHDPLARLCELKPESPGAYVYQFVLSDSLTIGVNYMVKLCRIKNKHEVISRDFFIEDYQLDENSYSLEAEKENFHRGEPMTLLCTGKDANGSNLMDARVRLTLKTGDIGKSFEKKIFVPNTLWTYEQMLDPKGDTRIVIPDSIFPKANLYLAVKATFLNSNNESQTVAKRFNFWERKNAIDVELKGADLEARYTENGKEKAYTCTLIKKYRTKEIRQTVNLPYKEPIDPFVKVYHFESDSISNYFYPGEAGDEFRVRSYRTRDSVFIHFANPRKLNVAYTIYKGDAEIETGSTQTLSWKGRESSTESYYVHYHYLWGGKERSGLEHIPLFDKELQVAVLQPTTVHPGEKAKVTVQVNDIRNKPVKDVNVTAFAFSKQFWDANVPELPYLGEARYGKTAKNNHRFQGELSFRKGNFALSETWRSRMKLDTLPFYKMLYPEKGIHYHYDPIQSAHAEFAPFLFRKGSRRGIYMVYLDQRLVYYYDAYNSSCYSFVAAPGYHSITIRSYDKSYMLDSVLLKQGLKTEIALDLDKLPPNVKVQAAGPVLSDMEQQTLRQSMFFFYSESKHDIYVWQNDHACFIPKRNYGRGASLYSLCGFFPDSLYYAEVDSFSQKFLFEPDYFYSVNKSLIKMKDYTPFKTFNVLPSSVQHPAMGMHALLANEIKLSSERQTVLGKMTKQASGTKETNGSVLLYYKGEQELRYVEMKRSGRDSLVRLQINKGSVHFNDLSPGYYQLRLITSEDAQLESDSVLVKPGGTLVLCLGDQDLRQGSKALTPSQASKHQGRLTVTITDVETGEGIPFANVIVYRNGIEVDVEITDPAGKSTLLLLPGKYTVKGVYVGYEAVQINGVTVNEKQTTYLNMKLDCRGGMLFDAVSVTSYSSVRRSVIPRLSIPGKISFDTVRNGDVLEMVKFTEPVIKKDEVEAESYDSFFFGGNTVDKDASPRGSFSKDKERKGVRNRFSDYAYWKPNLVTDKNGQVSFEVMFPDNLTGWQSYALAMDGDKHSGSGNTQTRSQLPLAANLSLPRFLVEGDSSSVIGKALNYTGNPLMIKSSFSVEGRMIPGKDTLLKEALIQSVALSTGGRDSLKVSFGIESGKDLSDAEERSIPVLPAGGLETEGTFLIMHRDTTFNLHLKEGETEIYVQQSSADLLLKQLQDLQNYPHACMEQTASKLQAYLMEEKIRGLLGQKFTHKAELKKLVKRLDHAQKSNGSWGWWEDSPENIWMTCYILDALSKARNAGYHTESTPVASKFLHAQLPLLKGNELLSALHVLSEKHYPLPYKDFLNKLDPWSLSFFQKLTVMSIQQNNGLPYDLDLLLREKKTTLPGNYYWGTESYDWFENSTQLTLLAYRLIERKDSAHPYLPLIRNYFLELKQQDKWRNTIETARILETILPAMSREESTGGASMELSGAQNETISTFPYKTKISGTRDLVIHKKGNAALYFTAYRKRWNKTPQKKEDNFIVRSHFESAGKQKDTLYAGQAVELVIEVQVKHTSDYLMLEVPIPAGCSYDNVSINKNAWESHRENYKHTTNIFCEHLPEGKHVFRIALQPRFKGLYTLNPARIEPMYFPVFYGSNGLSKTRIR